MEGLEKEILNAIKDKLPQVQVELLQERLNAGERAIKDLEEKGKFINSLVNESNLLREENTELKSIRDAYVSREKELEEREKKCFKIEQNWENEKLRLMLAAQKEMNNSYASVLETVFNSPMYQTHVSGTHGFKSGGQYGAIENLPFHQMVTQALEKKHVHPINNPNCTESNADV